MDATLYEHWSDVEGDWWWQYFTPREIACRGTGELLVVPVALNALMQARSLLARPMVINSAYRSRLHNVRVGGVPLSQHRFGTAFDISLEGQDRQVVLDCCKRAGFTGFGFYNAFLHVDLGRTRRWGSWT